MRIFTMIGVIFALTLITHGLIFPALDYDPTATVSVVVGIPIGIIAFLIAEIIHD